MDALAVFALAVAVVAVVVSSWHGLMAEEQLRLSRLTENEARKTLARIQQEMVESRKVSIDLANKINERITTILDTNVIAALHSQAIELALGELLEQDAAPRIVADAATPG